MIIPIRCFTCGKVVAHLYEDYRNILQDSLKNDDTLSISTSDTAYNTKKTLEGKALDDLGLDKYCCRRMFLCQNDICKTISHIL